MKSKIGTVFLSLYLALTSANCDIRKPSSEPKQTVSSSQSAKKELEDVIKLDFETWNFVLSPYRIAKDAFGAVIYAARDELKKKGQNEKDLSEQDMTKLLIGVCQKMDASKDSFVDNFEAEGYLHPDESFDGKNPFYKQPEVAAVSKEADVKTEKPVQVRKPEKVVEPGEVEKEPKYGGKVEVVEEKEPKYESKTEVEGPKEVISEREKPAKLTGMTKLEEIIERKKKELALAASKEKEEKLKDVVKEATPAASEKLEEKAGKEKVQETVPRDDLLDLFEEPTHKLPFIVKRCVIITDSCLWVHGKTPLHGLDFYYKYEISEFKGEKFLSMSFGGPREALEKRGIDIAQDFDRLERRLTEESESTQIPDFLELFDKPVQEKEAEPEKPQKDPFIGVDGYFTTTYKGREIAIPDKRKIMEIARLKDLSGAEIHSNRGFEYGGTNYMLDKLNAVYDIRHDRVKVTQDGDVYIVRPKAGDTALYIRIKGNTIRVAYDPKKKRFIGGTTEELNALGKEADIKEADKVLTGREMSDLIYNTFQAYKAKHPKIEQVKQHRTDYFTPKGREALEKELDEVMSDE